LDAHAIGPILTRATSKPGDEPRRSKSDGKEIMAHIVNKDELTYSTIAHKFEGYRYGGVSVSFFLVECPPGGGAVLHTHPLRGGLRDA
jgi:hypothetical protein